MMTSRAGGKREFLGRRRTRARLGLVDALLALGQPKLPHLPSCGKQSNL